MERNLSPMSQSSHPDQLSEQNVEAPVFVLWYWPNMGGKHFGYAFHKSFIFSGILLLLSAIIVVPFLFIPHTGLVSSIIDLILWLVLILNFFLAGKSGGYYEVNEQGQPLRRLTAKDWDDLYESGQEMGRPMRYKKFRRMVQSAAQS